MAQRGDIDRVVRALLSPRTGIVRRASLLPNRSVPWPLVRASAVMPRGGVIPGVGHIATPGGAGTSPEAAFIPCIFEAVERYCAAWLDHEALYTGPARDKDAFLFGDRLPVFAPWQYAQPGFAFRRLEPKTSVRWVPGRSLVTGKQHFIPSCFVHVPFIPSGDAERLGISTSTGVACAWTEAQAQLTGLWEVCERDAFSTLWLHRLSMPRLVFDEQSAAGREIAAFRRASGEHELVFVDLTTDFGLPTVMAVLTRPLRGKPAVTVGASTRATLGEAARKAMYEAAGQYLRLAEHVYGEKEVFRAAPDFSNVTDFEVHNLTYLDVALQPRLAFMTASPVERTVGEEAGEPRSPEALLADSVARFAARGEDVISVDLTTPEIRELGLWVTRIIVPGAVQLWAHHRYPPLGVRRIYTTPRVLGYRQDDARTEELNLDSPHPFA